MSDRTVRSADLCEAVYHMVGLSMTASADLVESGLNEISVCIVRGEAVKLSSFGSFVVRNKGERVGRNPKTGDSFALPGKNVPNVKPGKELRERVNEKVSDTTSALPA